MKDAQRERERIRRAYNVKSLGRDNVRRLFATALLAENEEECLLVRGELRENPGESIGELKSIRA